MARPICLYNGTVMTSFAAMENCAVYIKDGVIEDVFSERRLAQKLDKNSPAPLDARVEMVDVKGAVIAPGFIDTHIHGFDGHGTDDGTTEAILAMSRELPRCGVTAFNPTLYPSPREEMLRVVHNIAAAMGHEEGARIMGLHLEGPFISPEKLGVQKPDTVCSPDLGFMDQLWDASEGHVVNMTVAPELKGMRELALHCLKKGIVLQAGHTDAKYENMREGMQAGILHATHMFNAMSRMDHRNPNAAGAVLIHPEMSCEIIADGRHVHPDLFKLLHKDKPIDSIVLITDGLKPTAQKEGPFYANGEEVYWEADEEGRGLFRRKADDVIAGSGLTMIRGVQNLVKFGFSLDEACRCASFNPARVMHYREQGSFVPGNEADIVVFDADPDKDYEVKMTLVGGDIKYRSSL
jgi:N-acetylglucosamine-6-phosphate deacetylase